MTTALADDLLLLLLDPSGRPLTDSTRLPRALAGAVLVDLIQAGAVRLTGKGERIKPGRLVVVRSSLGDPLLDDALATLAAGTPRKPGAAIERLRGVRATVIERGVRAGTIRVERGRVWRIFPRTSWIPGGRREDLYAELVRVLTRRDVAVSDPRVVASIALLSAIGATARVFPDLDRRAVRTRAAEIGAGDWAAGAVRHAVQAIDAALVAAVTVGVASTVLGSS